MSFKSYVIKSIGMMVMLPAVLGMSAQAKAQFAQPVPERNTGYVGLGYIKWDETLKNNLSGVEVEESYGSGGIRARGGVNINDFFAFEVHAFSGDRDSRDIVYASEEVYNRQEGRMEIVDRSFSIKHEIDYGFGAYLRAATPVISDTRLYALAEATYYKMTTAIDSFEHQGVTFTGVKYSDDDISFSYGGGVEFLLMKGMSIKVDAMRYVNESNYSLDVVGVELGYRL